MRPAGLQKPNAILQLHNGFYIETKYPLDVACDPSLEDTTKALGIADKMIDVIEKQF